MSMPKRQKVLYLITKSNWGGAQKYVYDLATSLPDLDVTVALGGRGELKQKLEQVGVRTVSIPRLGRDIKIWDEPLVLWEIWKIIRREAPDVVHLNSPKAGGLGALAIWLLNLLKAKRLKAVYTAHGWPFAEERPAWQKLAIKVFSWFTILFCHQIIVIAKSEYEKVASWPGARRKLHLIYNGVSEPVFLPRAEAREKLGLKQGEFIIGTIAELHKNKGLEYLYAALTTNWQGDPLTWALIGDGERTVLPVEGRSLIKILPLGRRENAAQYLKAFDLFVLPSIKEGLPYVLLEAGLAALPTVATRVGGIPEIIEDGKTGLLVAPKDSPALAKAIDELRNDPEKMATLGRSLQAKVRAQFSPQQMLAETLKIYNN